MSQYNFSVTKLINTHSEIRDLHTYRWTKVLTHLTGFYLLISIAILPRTRDPLIKVGPTTVLENGEGCISGN
jgi:hypothetical protein